MAVRSKTNEEIGSRIKKRIFYACPDDINSSVTSVLLMLFLGKIEKSEENEGASFC